MSVLEYKASQKLELAALDIRVQTGANAFYSLIMAAMRQADTTNLDLLSRTSQCPWRAFGRRARMTEIVFENPTSAAKAGKLPRYTQIVYIPPHLQRLLIGSNPVPLNYPNGAQPGFISSGPTGNGDYFCRYWIIRDGVVQPELRTKANSERVSGHWIFQYDYWGNDVMEKAREFMERYG
jgi:hypothetical protein